MITAGRPPTKPIRASVMDSRSPILVHKYRISATQQDMAGTVQTLNRLRTYRTRSAGIIQQAGDITLVALARGLLGLACSAVSGFLVWLAIWSYVHGPALTGSTFAATMSLVIGTPSGLATSLLWRNAESPRRIRWLFTLVTLAVAVIAPYVVMLIRGINTYYGLFGGSLRLPVIDVSDALFIMLVTSAVAANCVAGALAVYRMARYREI